MSREYVLGMLSYMFILVLGIIIGENQIDKVDAEYVVIPSNRYCEGLGFTKEQPAGRKP